MKKIICSCLCVTGVMVLTRLVGGIIGSSVTGYFLQSVLAELVGVILTVCALLILKNTSIMKFKLQGVGEGLKACSPLLVLSVVIMLGYLGKHDPVTESSLNIVLFVLHMFLVGIYEEVLFRGIIQNAFHDYFGCETADSVRKGIIMAGVVFGATHLTNIFGGGEIVPVIIQAITVIPVGILFGTIYYRSNRNIWLCILLHAWNDFGALLRSGILSGGGSAISSINGYSGLKLISVLLYASILFVVMRKSKLRKMA